MKKELFAASLLAAIFILAIANNHHLETITDSMTLLILEAEQSSSNCEWDKAYDAANNAVNTWLSSSPYIHVVLRHDDIEALTDHMYELLEHIGSKDIGAISSAATLVKAHLHNIQNMDKIHLGSVF